MLDFSTEWSIPPIEWTLQHDEVHVWLAAYETFYAQIDGMKLLLSTEETKKASQFYFEKDRRRFIIAHSLLRMLLAGYTNLPAAQLNFHYNAYGKPELAFDSGSERLCFNISHSSELAVYAFAYARDVGVDIEYIRDDIEYEQLAKHYFSSFENSELQRLPLSLRKQAFFDCWTRKEAYIKARGQGLSLPLDSFDVTVAPGSPAELIASRERLHETDRWLFASLPVGTRYSGTLVAEGHDWHIRCWRLLPE